MISVGSTIRHALPADRIQIAGLGMSDADIHHHLDWRPALDWLGDRNYWVLEEDGEVSAALAFPEDPPRVAWIRLFGSKPPLTPQAAWGALWEQASSEFHPANPGALVAAIVTRPWFHRLLSASGFEHKLSIVLLNLESERFRPLPVRPQVHIRPMSAADLPSVTRIDLAAFGAFWHNTADALRRAFEQSVHATIAELDSKPVGYQISTGNPLGAHLARLGVLPEAQGMGIGTGLVSGLIRSMNGSGRLTVNTQSDNAASLALYRKMGFLQTGESFPVLVCPPGRR